MMVVELKLALIFALFFVVFTLRWIFGGRSPPVRRHRFWPRQRAHLAELPDRHQGSSR